ncbi:MAG: hypothetical protein M1482_07935 [Chloroflexi bacterium]|nr:hypothetical protein [Chloroflexota bacterium]
MTQKAPHARRKHSEAYWQAMKYIIIGLAMLMALALVLAVIVLLRVIPWS